MNPPATSNQPDSFHHALLTWWEVNGRHDLPWRATRDPWQILISELMLQQTQVPRVRTRWPELVRQFPTPAACAAAGQAAVVTAWAGLGYNRRAVNLHRCALQVVEQHDSQLPEDLDALLKLPGIGPYTARAILVFAFGHDMGLVDTNAGRFVARALAGQALKATEAQVVANRAVPTARGWQWGQAVFDLGASVCTKSHPACDRCPLAANHCQWAASGFATPDPIVGSAGISGRQSQFEGSDRQGRGRLVAALRLGPVAPENLALTMGWADDLARADKIVSSLTADGLVGTDQDGTFRLL